MIFSSIYRTRLIFILFISFCTSLYSQDYYDLLKVSDRYRQVGNLETAINYNINALKEHIKTNNTEYIITAYTNLGDILCTRNQYNKSLYFLDKAKKVVDKVNDPIVKSRLYFAYGRNYNFLELFEQSNINFNKSIQYAERATDPEKRLKYMFFGYYGKWDNFERMNIKDSVYSLQKKSMRLFPLEPLVYDKVASRYIKENIHLDSAEYYAHKALILTENHNIIMRAVVLTTLGNFYTRKKEYERALDFYQQSLEIYKKIKHEVGIFNTYKLISRTYTNLNDKKDETIYLEKYTFLKDSVIVSEKKVYNTVLEKFIKEKEEEESTHKKKLIIFISVIATIIIVAGHCIYKYYKRKQILETEQLKKKVNTAIDEVSQLAKAKDPFFLIRFKEVYPEFYEKLVTYHSNLTDHDIKIAAYMKLNLSNKEIIQYENITLRAIEMKKYRLKKKLGLASETDFNKWILEL